MECRATTQRRSTAKVNVRHNRPDAIKIKTTGEVPYIDILRQIKTASTPAPLGQRVSRIRRNRVGELLLELGKPGKETSELLTAVLSTLKDSATVMTLSHKESISVIDIDEATTEEEITEALSAVKETAV